MQMTASCSRMCNARFSPDTATSCLWRWTTQCLERAAALRSRPVGKAAGTPSSARAPARSLMGRLPFRF